MKISAPVSLALALVSLITPSFSQTSDPVKEQVPPAITLLHLTELPEITGDFDHLAFDLKRNHLFVTAEVHHSVEMFDLKTGEHLRSFGGFKTPHSIAYAPEKDELLVADGGDSALILLSGEDLQRTGRIPLIDGSATGKGDSPDAAYYDAPNRLLYIGNGGASANLPDSTISIFSVDQGKLIGDISIPGNNVESMGIDTARHRLFVNIRDKQQVGVVDLDTRKLLTTWTAPGMNKNTALVVDQNTHRVFVAGRNPGMLYVFDEEGNVVAQMPCVNINDDMHFDPEMKRLYISGSQGLNVFRQDSPNKYTELVQVPTNGGKTSTYVPSLRQLYIIHPNTSIDTAGLLVYRVNP